MSVFQAFLCGVVYFLAIGNLPFVGLWSLQRPLVCGLITGIILGDPLTGGNDRRFDQFSLSRLYFSWWINAC